MTDKRTLQHPSFPPDEQQPLLEQLRAEHARNEAILKTALDCIITIDHEGRIIEFNPAAEQTFGYARQSVLGKPMAELIVPPSLRERHRQAFARYLATGESTLLGRRVEMTALRSDGTEFPVELTVTRIPLDGPPVFTAYVRDVTERKQAEDALRQSEERFVLFMRHFPGAAWMKDIGGRYVYANETGLKIFRKPLGELRGKRDEEVFDPDTARQFQENDRLAVTTGETLETIETLPQEDGVHYSIVRKFPIRDRQGAPVLVGGIAIDITERKRAEDQLREYNDRLQTLSRRLVEVQEEERRRIARELHDEVGQALTGLRLLLEASADGLPEPARSKLHAARDGLEELVTRIRDLSIDLRPSTLDHFGLLPALRELFERYTAQTGVRVDFKHTGLEKRFGAATETAAYRMVQEALTNVARHARVNEVTVHVWAEWDLLELVIEDQGVGFDPSAALTGGRHSGLIGMQERVRLLSGELAIASAPAAGTHLTARLPVRGSTEFTKR